MHTAGGRMFLSARRKVHLYVRRAAECRHFDVDVTVYIFRLKTRHTHTHTHTHTHRERERQRKKERKKGQTGTVRQSEEQWRSKAKVCMG